MNLAEMRARLRSMLKNPSEVDVPNSQLTQYLNDGYRDVASRYPFHQSRNRCSFDTVAGHAKYALPSNCAAVLRLWNKTRGRRIKKAGDDKMVDRGHPTYNGVPTVYTRYKNYVELAPTPDGAYTIEVWYHAVQALLEADEDTPTLPELWHVGIVLRARWYAYLDMGDTALQTDALNSYTIWLSDKPGEIEEESVDNDFAVNLPTLAKGYGSGLRGGRFDDGTFDFRDD